MPRTPKSRSQRLTKDDFVTAALEYIDLHGAASLTARTLGESMQVDPTALYRHFPGMDELAGAILDRLFGEMINAQLPEGSPRERLRAHIVNVHNYFYKHPNALGLILGSKGDIPNGDHLTVIGLNMLRDLGLRDSALVVCHQMLESFLIGSHLYDLGGAPYHLEVRRRRRRRLDDPDIDRSTPTNESVDALNRAAFEAATEALLDYCEARASVRSTAPAKAAATTGSATKRSVAKDVPGRKAPTAAAAASASRKK